jgi:hypothetical protein
MSDYTDLNQAAICYYRTVFYTSMINVIAYLITLYHVMKGSNHGFLIALIVLLIVSDICAPLSNTFARVWIE